MFESTKALREQRGRLVSEARKILDDAEQRQEGQRELTAEEKVRWDKAHAEERALKEKIDRLESQERAESALAAPQGGVGREGFDGRAEDRATGEDRAEALRAWFRERRGLPVSERQEQAAKRAGLNLRQRELVMRFGPKYQEVRAACRHRAAAQRGLVHEQRALSAFTGTAGAYTIPEGFVGSLETALLAYAQIRDVCDVLRTDMGNDLPWPTVNDTTQKGHMIAENAAVATTNQPTFGAVVLRAYKATSDFILVPTELLEDSAFDLSGWLGDALGVRIGRLQADKCTTGTGAGEPTGIVTAATSGVSAASATAIAADEIYDLKHSVDPAYRPNAGFMMHDLILKAVKKLKDGFGRYLFQVSLAGGAPDTLDDDPITINQSMDSTIASGKKTMLYGDMTKFKLREVNEYRMYHLVERYRDSDQDAFGMFIRYDSNLIDAGTHPVKYMVH